MKDYSNKYIFTFSMIMVLIVASVLSFVAIQLQPLQDKNLETEKKLNILSAINVSATKEQVEEKYEEYIQESYTINYKGEIQESIDPFYVKLKEELDKPLEKQNLPLYIANIEDGGKAYVIPVRGKGLWGPIWGYIALEDDFNTVYGVTFGHKSETPGLGAEIVTEQFQEQFIGKRFFEDGQYKSIEVTKKSVEEDDKHKVSTISGATITSQGVEGMMFETVKKYQEFFKKEKK